MRTFKMIIDPTKNKKDAAFCQYFKTNTEIPNVCIILPIFISVIQ